MHHGYWPAEKEPYYVPPEEKNKQQLASQMADEALAGNLQDIVTDISPEEEIQPTATDIPVEEPQINADDDSIARANEIMARLAREAAADEAKKQAEIDAARKKADEDARLASILKSTKVDISGFINEGLASRSETHTEDTSSDTSSDTPSDEALRRAQEIMDRLNREAAEDEAKKQAEIEAAKEFARRNNL